MLTSRKIAGYGWRPSLPQLAHASQRYRDLHHSDALGIVVHPNLPANDGSNAVGATGGVDLRSVATNPPIFDQGQLGSCTANAWIRLYLFLFGGSMLSRLAFYYNERKLDGTIASDAGAQIADGATVFETMGTGLESDWPYDPAKFAVAPCAQEQAEEPAHEDHLCSHLETLEDFLDCLKQGFPFVIGISVYDSFESQQVAQTGLVPDPSQSENCVGGHAICVMGFGYINGRLYFLVANSWGDGWGEKGYFWISADYLTNPYLARDAWTARKPA